MYFCGGGGFGCLGFDYKFLMLFGKRKSDVEFIMNSVNNYVGYFMYCFIRIFYDFIT